MDQDKKKKKKKQVFPGGAHEHNLAKSMHGEVSVMMLNGQTLSGTLRGFDRFTITLEVSGVDGTIFKNGIVSIFPLSK